MQQIEKCVNQYVMLLNKNLPLISITYSDDYTFSMAVIYFEILSRNFHFLNKCSIESLKF